MQDSEVQYADAPAPMPKAMSFGAVLRAALRGEQHDYTRGSLDRAIVMLAIPMVLEMIMESLFAVVDVYWVSRLGADAVAAVGLTESLLALLYAIAMGLAMAATASVARRIGEKKPAEAANAAGQAIVLGLVVAVPIAVFGAMYAAPLLRAMGAPAGVIAMGGRYTAVMMGSSVTVLLLFLINAALRGAGDAASAMRVLWLANGLNIVLGPIFIFGFHLGVTGAAIATTLGRSIGVLYQLWILLRPRGQLRLRIADFFPRLSALGAMVRISIGGIVQSIIGTASWVVQVRLMAPFGAAALAGYTIGIRVIVFAILPAWGLANAAATLVGQNLGANAPDRAEAAVMRAGIWNTIVLSAVGLTFFLAARPIVGFFTHDSAVMAYGASTLRIVALGFPFYGFGMVFGGAFNGAGDTRTPTYLNLLCFWAMEMPLAWLLSRRLRFGPPGISIAIAFAFSAFALVAWAVFRQGTWKKTKV